MYLPTVSVETAICKNAAFGLKRTFSAHVEIEITIT
jgi:hypothetical protein